MQIYRLDFGCIRLTIATLSFGGADGYPVQAEMETFVRYAPCKQRWRRPCGTLPAFHISTPPTIAIRRSTNTTTQGQQTLNIHKLDDSIVDALQLRELSSQSLGSCEIDTTTIDNPCDVLTCLGQLPILVLYPDACVALSHAEVIRVDIR
eukprot:scaffold19818_cov32-Prasinocladus_malaysianus.AAC.3